MVLPMFLPLQMWSLDFLHVKLTSLPKNVGWRGLIENMGFNGRFWHDNIKKWNIAISSVGCPVAPQSLHFLKFRSFEIPTFFATSNWTWYCGWKKSCTTWDDRKPINNGMFTTYELVQDFATIHSSSTWGNFRTMGIWGIYPCINEILHMALFEHSVPLNPSVSLDVLILPSGNLT